MPLYLIRGPDNSLSLSGYPSDSKEYETNHVNLLDYYKPRSCTYEALRNMLTNVLRDADVKFIEE